MHFAEQLQNNRTMQNVPIFRQNVPMFSCITFVFCLILKFPFWSYPKPLRLIWSLGRLSHRFSLTGILSNVGWIRIGQRRRALDNGPFLVTAEEGLEVEVVVVVLERLWRRRSVEVTPQRREAFPDYMPLPADDPSDRDPVPRNDVAEGGMEGGGGVGR